MLTEIIKYKQLTIDRLIISFDRLTRFKNTEEKYLRVFKDILTDNLIVPKLNKSELNSLDYVTLRDYATQIINNSLPDKPTTYKINKQLLEYEEQTFFVDSNTRQLLDNKINYDALISVLPDQVPNNLEWIRLMSKSNHASEESLVRGYQFPIKRVVICEGITEEILLPEFAKYLDYDFSKNGVKILSAGGKNQVVKMFYKLVENLKLPMFILMDNDATKNRDEILPRLRSQDKIYIIQQGEFEDILPVNLIEKALKSSIKNISDIPDEHFDKSLGTVYSLEEFYKNRGSHEFKKAEFAKVVRDNISDKNDISLELRYIIDLIKAL
jgi:hypothetical protein